MGSSIRSRPQILVGFPAAARAAVIVGMSTKSRQTIYGGAIMGAKIRAESARKRAAEAAREADRAEAEAWSIQMEALWRAAHQPSANERRFVSLSERLPKPIQPLPLSCSESLRDRLRRDLHIDWLWCGDGSRRPD